MISIILSAGLLISSADPAQAQRSQASRLLLSSKAMIKSGKVREALPLVQKAIELDPTNPDGYCTRGSALYKLEETDKAMKDLDKCIELNGNRTKANKIKCQIYFERKQLRQALECATEAIKYSPDKIEKSESYRVRGKLYLEINEPTKAIIDFNQSIALEPEQSNAFKHRGNAYMSMKLYQKAIDDYTTGLKTDKTDRDIFLTLRAQAYEKIGRKDLAAADRKKTQNSVLDEWGDFMKPGSR
ncbi:MAG: tetratricopeptide repeat protein [Cyanobacteria bacterium SZAS LIN-3]|nr:tetratricopeptide repeat protein [Cyanobacteria bacterium SZAS LIN-3]